MQKTLLIYESKYGTTEKIARYLSLVLGPAKYCRTGEFKDLYKDFDFVVIGSPVYSGKLEPRICQFVENNLDWLKEKAVALFCTCLSPSDGNENLNDLAKTIGKVVDKNVLGGVLKQSTLNEEDKKALQLFSEKIGFELEDIDNFNLEEVLKYALELKLIKDDLMPKAPSPKVKKTIENFLTTHNTCTLSTSYKNRVRSTPIEYLYSNGFIYFLSEGGEKFSNIPLNKNISVAVYDDYTSMESLAGMQITGSAYIIPEDTDEYYDVIKMKGLNENFIKNLQVNMNIIKIEINMIEFLYSKFKEMDFEPKQIYFFPKHL
ncbi:MAG: flavodoxin domain-containing protein [Methanobacterium sp.]